MRAGRLDRLITIQSFTKAVDAFHQPIETWANLDTNPTVWAERRDLRGREYFQAQQVNAEVTAIYRLRWRGDLTTQMRIVDSGVTYEIVSPPIEIGRREGLELMVKAVI